MSQDWSSGTTKAEGASRAVNRVLKELVWACRAGEKIRDRCHVSVIGYGEEVKCIVDGMISKVTESLIEFKKAKKLIPDGAGGVIEVEMEMPIWVEARAKNGTPMHEAFERAAEIVQRWCAKWPNGFPPSVINITDGAANDPAMTETAASKVMNLGTADGKVLVYNLHIANSEDVVILPNDTSQFAGDSFAEFLFSISSEVPEPLRQEAIALGIPAKPGARCFAYNADEGWMIRLLNFGSLQVIGGGQNLTPLPD